jgi:hypothetical protein
MAVRPRKDGNIVNNIINIKRGLRPLNGNLAKMKAVNILSTDVQSIVNAAIMNVFLNHKGKSVSVRSSI